MNAFVAPGDFTGDGRADLLARKTNGDLMLYHGTGTVTGGMVYPPARIGGGWEGMNGFAAPGDITGDSRADLLARQANGDLMLYRGTGAGNWSTRPRGSAAAGTSTRSWSARADQWGTTSPPATTQRCPSVPVGRTGIPVRGAGGPPAPPGTGAGGLPHVRMKHEAAGRPRRARALTGCAGSSAGPEDGDGSSVAAPSMATSTSSAGPAPTSSSPTSSAATSAAPTTQPPTRRVSVADGLDVPWGLAFSPMARPC